MLAVRQKRSDFERQALVHVDALYGAAYRLTRNPRDAASAEQDATDGVLVQATAHDKMSPDKAMLAASVSDDVQRALEQLPDDFRTAVILCDMQGLSYKEIADIMETPVGTVMSRLF